MSKRLWGWMLGGAFAFILVVTTLGHCGEVNIKSTEKDGWEVTRTVPGDPVPLNSYLYREVRKASKVATYFLFTWYFLGIDGSGTLRIERWEMADLKESQPRVRLYAHRQDEKQGIWKAHLFATVDYTAELEIKELGDNRVSVKWVNPPKQQ